MTMYYPTSSPMGVKKASCKCPVALRQGHQQTQWKVPKNERGAFYSMHWWYIGGTNLVSGHLRYSIVPHWKCSVGTIATDPGDQSCPLVQQRCCKSRRSRVRWKQVASGRRQEDKHSRTWILWCEVHFLTVSCCTERILSLPGSYRVKFDMSTQ